MVKFETGKFILSEKDINNMKKEIINGKTYYVIYTKEKNQNLENLSIEDFEKHILEGWLRKDFVEKYNLTNHYIIKFMKKNYNSNSINYIKSLIENRNSFYAEHKKENEL